MRLVVAGAAIVALLVGCGAQAPQTRLSLTVDDGNLGLYEFSLSCNPAAGTVPDPAAACAELDRRPELVTTRRGPRFPNSCPPGAHYVRVKGLLAGKKVSTRLSLSACVGGTEDLAGDWLRMLRVPRFPLEIASGRAFTDRLVISSGKDAVRVRYRRGERFAIAFPLTNLSSAPLTIVENPWTRPAGQSRASGPTQLLRLIGVHLSAAPVLAPVTSERMQPYTIQPGATVWIQKNFVIAGCSVLRPGRRYIYNKVMLVWFRNSSGGTAGVPLDLRGYWLAINAPADCPQ